MGALKTIKFVGALGLHACSNNAEERSHQGQVRVSHLPATQLGKANDRDGSVTSSNCPGVHAWGTLNFMILCKA